MKTRQLGNTGQRVSEIGLGCWQLGGSDWGALDDQNALEILNAAADEGVNFFDTADVYGGGRSETLVGRFLSERAGEFFVATKLGRMPDLYPDQYTEDGVRAATEASLRRLGVETLDLTQLHCVPPEVMKRGEIFEWLRALRDEGKIRAFGASVETVEEADLCLGVEDLCSVQVIFNLFRQQVADAFFDRASKSGIGVIVRLPLASGLLAGKMSANQKFPDNDHRNYNRDGDAFNVGETFAGLPFDKGVALADELKSILPEGMTLADMSQRWILDHEAVSTVITGASKSAQASANAAVSELPPLSAGLHDELEEFFKARVIDHIRGAV